MKFKRLQLLVVLCVLGLVFALSACDSAASGLSQASDASGVSASAASDQAEADAVASAGDMRAEIEAAMAAARDNTYKNVAFKMSARTSVVGTDQGKTVQQAVLTTMNGQLSLPKKKADRKMHFDYESRSSALPTKTAYEMFVDSEQVLVKQNDQLFLTGDDVKPENYFSLITNVASEDEVGKLLDVAGSCKLERAAADDAEEGADAGDTVITITADVTKLEESGLVDTSSLPEGSSIATMVANYVISPDNHFRAVRLMSSTSGSPTYRVYQTYAFSDYDAAKLPDWPDASDRALMDDRIQKDDDGTLYIMQDGVKYIIDSINDDGTVQAHPEGSVVSDDGAYISYDDAGGYYYGGGGSGGGGGRTSSGGSGGGGGGGSASGGGGSGGGGGGGGGDVSTPSVSEGEGGSTDISAPVLTEGE